MILAVALLPYGHSVVDTSTGELDSERTDQLTIFYSVLYGMPYFVLQIVFALTMVLAAVAIGDSFRKVGQSEGTTPKFHETLRKSFADIRPTIGFYFYHTGDDTDRSSD